jgi:acyl-coenzyme A thioesterase PaaI-like protein
VRASGDNRTLSLWRRFSSLPGGKWLFSRLVCLKAPYFASVRPRFETLEPARAEVRSAKRRAVLNHIGTVHAIAMCNMAELAAGTMTDATIPATHRWIPKGMTVQYLRKAETSLRAVARIDPLPEFGAAAELPVTVDVIDTRGEVVLRAVITMWVSPKR